MKEFKVDKLNVYISDTSDKMGEIASEKIAEEMRRVIKEKDNIRMMFAAAPSQDTTLSSLLKIKDLPWEKVVAFHMDEYIGITLDKPQSFRNYLKRKFFNEKPFKKINLIEGDNPNSEEEALRYARLLDEEPMDIIVLGIGENGHIAFNDPPYSSFDYPFSTRIIELAEKSRIQQVNDGCFSSLEEVPKKAITVTIPVFKRAKALFCVVPNNRKAEAVKKTLEEEISELCPASILRKIENSNLFLDEESASLL